MVVNNSGCRVPEPYLERPGLQFVTNVIGEGLASTPSSHSASQAGRKHCRTLVWFRKNLADRLPRTSRIAEGVGTAAALGGLGLPVMLSNVPARCASHVRYCISKFEDLQSRNVPASVLVQSGP